MLEVVAILSAGVFTGAAIYISVVQHPASFQVGGSMPATFFRPMYRRAAPMQAGLALVGSIAGLLAWFSGSSVVWLVGAVSLGSVIPFTLFCIKPINDELVAPGLDPAAPEVLELLRRWGRLHGVRSVASGLAFLCFALG